MDMKLANLFCQMFASIPQILSLFLPVHCSYASPFRFIKIETINVYL